MSTAPGAMCRIDAPSVPISPCRSKLAWMRALKAGSFGVSMLTRPASLENGRPDGISQFPGTANGLLAAVLVLFSNEDADQAGSRILPSRIFPKRGAGERKSVG